MNKERIHESIRMLKTKQKMWERLFFTEKCQLIKVGGMIELEKHHLATTSVIFDSAKVIHGC